jgi:hypothetical protein
MTLNRRQVFSLLVFVTLLGLALLIASGTR